MHSIRIYVIHYTSYMIVEFASFVSFGSCVKIFYLDTTSQRVYNSLCCVRMHIVLIFFTWRVSGGGDAPPPETSPVPPLRTRTILRSELISNLCFSNSRYAQHKCGQVHFYFLVPSSGYAFARRDTAVLSLCTAQYAYLLKLIMHRCIVRSLRTYTACIRMQYMHSANMQNSFAI